MSYHPSLGRFLERDPVGYVDGLNLYEYVSSNPVNHVDSLGLSRSPSQDEIRRRQEQLKAARTRKPNECVIEVRFNTVGGGLASHSYIIVTNPDGSQEYVRAGPSNGGSSVPSSAGTGATTGGGVGSSTGIPGAAAVGAVSGGGSGASSGSSGASSSPNGSGGYGNIIAEHGRFTPGTIDYDPNYTPQFDGFVFRTMDKCECDVMTKKLRDFADQVNARNINYNLLGPNSNTFVNQALQNSGINSPQYPSANVPGWDDDFGD